MANFFSAWNSALRRNRISPNTPFADFHPLLVSGILLDDKYKNEVSYTYVISYGECYECY